jgi:hypothetical protein
MEDSHPGYCDHLSAGFPEFDLPLLVVKTGPSKPAICNLLSAAGMRGHAQRNKFLEHRPISPCQKRGQPMIHYRLPLRLFATRSLSNQMLGVLIGLLMLAPAARAQTWTPLNIPPSFRAGTALLLTDGTVMVQQMTSSNFGTGQWWRLIPDITGSYVNGSWQQLASMPSGYAPRYYASAVLPDGRLVVIGGENNGNNKGAETNRGAIYDPANNIWTSVNPPSGVTEIGDAASVVLSNGTFMLGSCCSSSQYLLNASNLTWTVTGSGKADSDSEEGWTLLPNGKVLTVDTRNGTNAELYDPSTGSWSLTGNTIVALSDGSPNFEVGPAVLRPDGTVFATGSTSNTAMYNSSSGTWSVGPTFSNGLDIADGPAALLPSGNVLVDASPGVFNSGSQFFEFNGTNLIVAPNPPRAGGDPSFVGRMLVLPTGQILFTDESTQMEIYTPGGTYQSSWQPTISSVSSTLTPGSVNNAISGTQFNGLSQGAMYGDDSQAATNYPLVQITNNATGHVFYAKTHNHSTMGVATGSAVVSTQFDVPISTEPGASTVRVVANGIPSNGTVINIAGLPNFSFTVDGPSSVDESQTNEVVYTYNVGFQFGLGGTVTVSISNDVYNFASPYLVPSTFTSSGTGTLYLILPSGVTPGVYTFTLTGQDGTIIHSVPMTLTITQDCC